MGVELELGGLGAHLRVAQRQLERANAVLDRELPLLFIFGGRREIDDGLGLEHRPQCRAASLRAALQRFGGVARFVRGLRGLQLALQRVALANRACRQSPAAA